MCFLLIFDFMVNVRPTANLGPTLLAGGILGFWYSPWLLYRWGMWRGFRGGWGLPHVRTVDLIALSIWLACLSALAANALGHRPIRYAEYNEPAVIRTVWMLAAGLVLYLWFRALKWLQQRSVTGSSQRLVLFLVLLPTSFLASVNVGILLQFLPFLIFVAMGLVELPNFSDGYVLLAGALVESLIWTLVLLLSYRYVTRVPSSELSSDSNASSGEMLVASSDTQAAGPASPGAT